MPYGAVTHLSWKEAPAWIVSERRRERNDEKRMDMGVRGIAQANCSRKAEGLTINETPHFSLRAIRTSFFIHSLHEPRQGWSSITAHNAGISAPRCGLLPGE